MSLETLLYLRNNNFIFIYNFLSMDDYSKQIENVQIKLVTISKDRQIQLSEIKSYFDMNNKIFYKDIVLLDLDLIYEIFQTKAELKTRYMKYFLYNFF